MCVIIDANVASLVFGDPPDDNFLPVFQWLSKPNKDGRVVVGGRLADELYKVENVGRWIRTLNQAGRAPLLPKVKVDAEEQQVIQLGLCKSDDPHIIALARLSGARTLCSHDKDLHQDFKNVQLISDPKGCVYQCQKHARLLTHTTSCGKSSKH